jgi:ribosomal protein S27E
VSEGDGADREVKDLPWHELVERLTAVLKQGNATVYVKFTCQGCGSRQTFDRPNVLYTSGLCEECGRETSLLERGGGFAVVFGLTDAGKTFINES